MRKVLLLIVAVALGLGAYSLLTDVQAQEAADPATKSEVKSDASEAAPAAEEAKIDPVFEKDIRKLVDLLGIEKSVRASFEAGIAQLKTRAPQVPAEKWDNAMAKVEWSRIADIYVPVYAKHLSQEDVKAAIAFYESPAGTRLMGVQPVIAREAGPAMQAWGQQSGMQIMQEVMAAAEPQPGPVPADPMP